MRQRAEAQGTVGGNGGALALRALATPAPEATRLSFYGVGAPPAATGQAAVEYSRALGDLKTASTASGVSGATVSGQKVVAGRTFALRDGVWAEVREKKADETAQKKALKIKYLSDAYFDLVRLRPDLKSVFALGERIELDIADYHIVIGPEGEEKLTQAQMDDLAPKKK